MSIEVPIVLAPSGTIPSYQTPESAGMDLCAAEDAELMPGERRLIATGVKLAIPFGFEGQIRPRSGLAVKHGVTCLNTPGTIDSDYRGEIKVLLINLGQSVVKFFTGDRIAQVVFCPVVRAELIPVETLADTVRGEGGFGSTGL